MIDFKRLYLQAKVWLFQSLAWFFETIFSPKAMLGLCAGLAAGCTVYAGHFIAAKDYTNGAWWAFIACLNGASALMSKDRIAIAKRLVVLEQEAAQLENIAAQAELHYILLVTVPYHGPGKVAERIGSA